MTDTTPNRLCSAIERETAVERAYRSVAFLSIHEFITEPEEDKILQRINKWRQAYERRVRT